MSGRKRSSRTVLPWLTARSDGKEGRFIQVGNSLLLDKRVQQLSGNAMRLYLCMAMESGGRRHFLFPQAVGKKYGICPAGLWRGMAELEEKGFLKCEKAGKINRYQALISRADYERQEGKSVLSKLDAGSLKRFAAALYDGGALSGEDVAELRAYLDTLGKE